MTSQISIVNDAALDTVSGGARHHVTGAETAMIELQSLVSQRSTAMQMATGMMRLINDSTKSVAGNIGR